MGNLSYQPCNKCLHFKWSVVFLIHRIMASLNLLRYLVIKDCESENQVSSNWFETDWFLISRGLRISSSQKHVFCIFLPAIQKWYFTWLYLEMYNVLFYPDEIWLHSYLIVTINKLILLLCLMRSGHYLVCHHKITSLSRIPIRKKKLVLIIYSLISPQVNILMDFFTSLCNSKDPIYSSLGKTCFLCDMLKVISIKISQKIFNYLI